MVKPAVEKEIKSEAKTHVNDAWVDLNKTVDNLNKKVDELQKMIKPVPAQTAKRPAETEGKEPSGAPAAKKPRVSDSSCKQASGISTLRKHRKDDDDEDEEEINPRSSFILLGKYQSKPTPGGSKSATTNKDSDNSSAKETKTAKQQITITKEKTPKKKGNAALSTVPPGVKHSEMKDIMKMSKTEKVRLVQVNNRKEAQLRYRAENKKNENAALLENIRRTDEEEKARKLEEKKRKMEELRKEQLKRRDSQVRPSNETDKQRREHFERTSKPKSSSSKSKRN